MKDIFGIAFKEYIESGIDRNIKVKTNLGIDSPIPVSYFFRNFEQMPEIEKYALLQCKGLILDVGAGAGCHSVFLEAKNLLVDAIEISEGCVEVMKQRGVSNVFLKSIFDIDKKYDTILLLMNGIGIMQTIEGLKMFLSKVPYILNKGGQILFTSADVAYMYMDADEESYVFDLNKPYYGEMMYQVSYKRMQSDKFGWLYIDYDKAEFLVQQYQLKIEHLFEDDNGHYLAKITL